MTGTNIEGIETELENSENGEYETEMEKGGEVALEQFHITRLYTSCFKLYFSTQYPLGIKLVVKSQHKTRNCNGINGEYETEMEKGGEVALEQFHITRLIHSAFNVRAGHLIVPNSQVLFQYLHLLLQTLFQHPVSTWN